MSRRPGLAACFYVQFDNRRGYTLKWHKALDGLELEGTLEFKCLPSGLHNVKEDLISFVHEGCVGLSAFRREDATEAERNARFVSIGVLAPEEHIWLYAEQLKELATKALPTPDDVQFLEDFWIENTTSTPSGQAQENNDAALVAKMQTYNPTASVDDMLEELGPLLFPIYRATLLRHRVLLLSQPPLHKMCNYVHILSELSKLPLSSQSDLGGVPEKVSPLYTVGVNDISMITDTSAWQGVPQRQHDGENSRKAGWIACTSDDLLALKTSLSECRVKFPNTAKAKSGASRWPSLVRSGPQTKEATLKATQRDLRRFQVLRQTVSKLTHMARKGYTDNTVDDEGDDAAGEDDDNACLLPAQPPDGQEQSLHTPIPDESLIVEPLSWAASLHRWSAQGTLDAEQEQEQDEELCRVAERNSKVHSSGIEASASDSKGGAAALVAAFFQQMTTQILSTVRSRVAETGGSDFTDEPSDDEDERAPLNRDSAEQRPLVIISKDDMMNMSLDAWSQSDQAFVGDVVKLYFGRQAEVRGPSVEVCGVRVC